MVQETEKEVYVQYAEIKIRTLKKFINYCFKNTVIKSVSLTVFDNNKNAKALYEKLGFEIVETINKPDLKYIMKKYR